ncbi:MAG: phosphatidylcholine synthase [Sphingomonadales bacterium]|jgi:phosphatidylcholine synthase|nr:phosphatidylcholine synthase [Sphingomonadales bacterium]
MGADEDRPRRARAAAAEAAPAWAVHALTATSALFALLALDAVLDERWRLALLWLLSALAVDGIDGTLARAVDVKRRTPGFDGAALDLIVDYLTYVFVPTLFIWRAGLVPDDWALPLAALIQYSALYHFARSDMKTEDNYFRGFPALWNLVAFYLWVIGTSETAGGIVVALLALSSFTSVAFVHPFRVRDYGAALPALALIWALATVALLWPDWSEGARGAIFWTSVATGLVLIGLGLWRAVRGPRLSPMSS